MPKYRPEDERFWEKVDRDGPIPEAAPHLGPCWLWTASRDQAGYGQFGKSRGGVIKAYRWAWESVYGPRPAHLQLDHLCRVRRCVRPDHLQAVTPRTNLDRGLSVATLNRAKTQCPRGHAYDYVNPKTGHRSCTTCSNRSRRVDPSGEPRVVYVTEEQKGEIRARYAQGGVTQLEIAREFGLSLGAIARAIRSDPSYTKRAYKTRAK